ncbi:hypothetical protein TNCV_438151 [Trichonephila clavipes]|nr:hypothetical protein TNCV_438151 [Trichonephila clavipes]
MNATFQDASPLWEVHVLKMITGITQLRCLVSQKLCFYNLFHDGYYSGLEQDPCGEGVMYAVRDGFEVCYAVNVLVAEGCRRIDGGNMTISKNSPRLLPFSSGFQLEHVMSSM